MGSEMCIRDRDYSINMMKMKSYIRPVGLSSLLEEEEEEDPEDPYPDPDIYVTLRKESERSNFIG